MAGGGVAGGGESYVGSKLIYAHLFLFSVESLQKCGMDYLQVSESSGSSPGPAAP